MKLRIDNQPIQHNAGLLRGLTVGRGLELAAVLKSAFARPEIAAALVAGGIRRFYLSNPASLPALSAVPRHDRALIGLPRQADIADIPKVFGLSLQSDLSKVDALERAASAAETPHGVLLAVDLGDRREGLLPEEVAGFAAKLAQRRRQPLFLEGLLVNYACASGFLPAVDHFAAISNLVRRVEDITGDRLGTVSIGGSVALDFLLEDVDYGRVNEMRSGEALLLGVITNARRPIPGLNPDAFIFSGEVLESKARHISAGGRRGLDAMNSEPRIGPEGLRHRVLVDFGSHHTAVHSLSPRMSGLQVVTASGEYTILDATALSVPPRVGDTIDFTLDYASLSAALLSPLVETEMVPYAAQAEDGVAPAHDRSRRRRSAKTRPQTGGRAIVGVRA